MEQIIMNNSDNKYLIVGEKPTNVTVIDLPTEEAEFCFIQDMPIIIDDSNMVGMGGLFIPDSLEWIRDLVISAIEYESDLGSDYKYVYLTVRRMWGVGNRGGWHTDGFGTDDINYIWADVHPTQFLDVEPFNVSTDCHESMNDMTQVADTNKHKIHSYPDKTLIRLTPQVLHRVNPEWFDGLRTFVKVSFSNNKYNLIGNTKNPILNYEWEMFPRDKQRNNPAKLGNN